MDRINMKRISDLAVCSLGVNNIKNKYMKKFFFFYSVIVILMVICISYSCSNNYDVDKGNKLSSEYTEALNTNDYEKAHQVLNDVYSYYNDVVVNNMEVVVGDISDNERNIKAATTLVCDALKKIYSEEIRYLAYSDLDNNWERIVNLLKFPTPDFTVNSRYPKFRKAFVYRYFGTWQIYVKSRGFAHSRCGTSIGTLI